MRNVLAALLSAAQSDPASLRVIDADGQEWSNERLVARMFAVQAAVRRFGRSRVVVSTRSAGEFWASMLGATAAGCDAIPVADGAPRSMHDRVVTELSPALRIDDEFLSNLPPARLDGAPEGDGGVILLSSGTTGRSQFVVRSGSTVGRIAEVLCGEGLYRAGDRCHAVLPLHHAYGFEHAFLGPALGGCSVRHGSQFDPAEMEACIAGATVLATVPAALRALLDAGFPRSNLRQIITAGTSLAPSLRRRTQAAQPSVDLIDLYGATELGTIWLDRGFGGRPVPGVEVRLAGADSDHRSEVLVRSETRLEHYFGSAESPVDADGWFCTGDIGTELPGGGLAIVGRSKLIFDVGGLKVNPHDVEAALEEHPAVRAAIVGPVRVAEDLVRVAATIEVADVSGAACPSAATLREHLRNMVAPHAIPRSFEFVQRLPRTQSGKVIRQRQEPQQPAASPTTRRRKELADVEERRRWTTKLFDESADGYDWSSAAGTLWSDLWYRRRQLLAAGLGPSGEFLDVGGGTGRSSVVATQIVGPTGRVVLVDPSPGMSGVAARRGIRDVRIGYAESLPVEDSAFDVVLLGYMLRHVEDMNKAFAEAHRVLRPMGRICILEVSQPVGAIGRSLFRIAAAQALPLIARLGSGRPAVAPMMAYWAETMADAVAPDCVLSALGRAGFVGTRHRRELGIFSSYRGIKPGSS